MKEITVLCLMIISGLLLIYFWTQIRRNWPAWNAACMSARGVPMRTHLVMQMKRPIFFHNFKSWTDPALLGYPVICAGIGSILFLIASANAVWMHANNESANLSSISGTIIAAAVCSMLPVLALRLALRDRASIFGQELAKQREIFGLFKSEAQKLAEAEGRELSEAVAKQPEEASERAAKRL